MEFQHKLQHGFTIDSASSMDLDDGIWCETASDDSILVTVFIVNAAAFVKLDSGTDHAAFSRGFSQYRDKQAVHPMLPRSLSESSGSLLPGEVRPAFAVRLKFDPETLNLKDSEIEIVTFRSLRRFTFEAAAYFAKQPVNTVQNDEDTSYTEAFRLLARLTRHLSAKSKRRGAVNLLFAVEGWEVTEDLQIVKLASGERNIGYQIIQEFAILANRVISEFMESKKIPFLFRNHRIRFDKNAPPETAALRRLVFDEIKDYLQKTENINQNHLTTLLTRLRSGTIFERAFYAPENFGHMGLAFSAYAHHTSPLRRYADLINQRQLQAWLSSKPFPYAVNDLKEISVHLNKLLEMQMKSKKEALELSRIDKRIKIVKAATGAGANTHMIKEKLSLINAGEFHKTAEMWLENIKLNMENGKKAKYMQADDTSFLFDIMTEKIERDNLPPKTEVLLLTTGMFDAPAKEKRILDKNLIKIKKLILDTMGLAPERAISFWMIVKDVLPHSKWETPQYEYISRLPKEGFTCTATIKGEKNKKYFAKATAPKKRQAKALASLYLLIEILGFELSDFDLKNYEPKTEVQVLDKFREHLKCGKNIFSELNSHFAEKNYKTALFEFAARTGLPPPEFLSDSTKDTSQINFYETKAQINLSEYFDNEIITGTGAGYSKRLAEKIAAGKILTKISEKYEVENFIVEIDAEPSAVEFIRRKIELLPPVAEENFSGAIETYFRRLKIKLPIYEIVGEKPINLKELWTVSVSCVFDGKSYEFIGDGISKAVARRNASEKLYKLLVKIEAQKE